MNEQQSNFGFPKLMTENELIRFLRIHDVSNSMQPQNVVANLRRCHDLPCIPISRRPLYPLAAIKKVDREEGRRRAIGVILGSRARPLLLSWSSDRSYQLRPERKEVIP